jgi:dUTP pyrophosphatase
MQIEVTRLDPDLPLPSQQHEHDAGYDLHAREDVRLEPGGGRALVPTGIAVAIPAGCAGLVLPRSGLALTHGVTCLNAPGLIDPLYRGEVKVLLVNTDPGEAYEVRRGDRIAQLVVTRVEAAVEWIEVPALDDTSRDTFGFGSTGR